MKVRLLAKSFIDGGFHNAGEIVDVPDGSTDAHYEPVVYLISEADAQRKLDADLASKEIAIRDGNAVELNRLNAAIEEDRLVLAKAQASGPPAKPVIQKSPAQLAAEAAKPKPTPVTTAPKPTPSAVAKPSDK